MQRFFLADAVEKSRQFLVLFLKLPDYIVAADAVNITMIVRRSLFPSGQANHAIILRQRSSVEPAVPIKNLS